MGHYGLTAKGRDRERWIIRHAKFSPRAWGRGAPSEDAGGRANCPARVPFDRPMAQRQKRIEVVGAEIPRHDLGGIEA